MESGNNYSQAGLKSVDTYEIIILQTNICHAQK